MKKLTIAAALGLASLSAQAVDVVSSFDVTATVLDSCEATSNGNMVFAAFAPTSAAGQNEDALTSLNVQCTKTTPFTVKLDVGSGGGNILTGRFLTDGTDDLVYNLYSDAARTQIIGDDVAAPGASGTGDGTVQSFPIYGRMSKNQFVTPGVYSSTIGVTVTY